MMDQVLMEQEMTDDRWQWDTSKTLDGYSLGIGIWSLNAWEERKAYDHIILHLLLESLQKHHQDQAHEVWEAFSHLRLAGWKANEKVLLFHQFLLSSGLLDWFFCYSTVADSRTDVPRTDVSPRHVSSESKGVTGLARRLGLWLPDGLQTKIYFRTTHQSHIDVHVSV